MEKLKLEKTKKLFEDFFKVASIQYGMKNGFNVKFDDSFYEALLVDIYLCNKLVVVFDAEEGNVDTIFIDKSFQEIKDYLKFDKKHDKFEVLMIILPNKKMGDLTFLRTGYKADYIESGDETILEDMIKELPEEIREEFDDALQYNEYAVEVERKKANDFAKQARDKKKKSFKLHKV